MTPQYDVENDNYIKCNNTNTNNRTGKRMTNAVILAGRELTQQIQQPFEKVKIFKKNYKLLI